MATPLFAGGINPTLLILQQLAQQAAQGQARSMQPQSPLPRPTGLRQAPAASQPVAYRQPQVRVPAEPRQMSADEALLTGAVQQPTAGSNAQTLQQAIAEIDELLMGTEAPERKGFFGNLLSQRFRPDEFASYSFKRAALPGGDAATRQALLDRKAGLQAQLAGMRAQQEQTGALQGVQEMLLRGLAPGEQGVAGGYDWINRSPDMSQMPQDSGLEGARAANILFPNVYDNDFMSAQSKAIGFPLEQAGKQADVEYKMQQTQTSKAQEEKYYFDMRQAKRQFELDARKFQLDFTRVMSELESKEFDRELLPQKLALESSIDPEISVPYFTLLRDLAAIKVKGLDSDQKRMSYEALQQEAGVLGQVMSILHRVQTEEGRTMTTLVQAEKLLDSDSNLDGAAKEALKKLVVNLGGQLVQDKTGWREAEVIGAKNGLTRAETVLLHNSGLLHKLEELSNLAPEQFPFHRGYELAKRNPKRFEELYQTWKNPLPVLPLGPSDESKSKEPEGTPGPVRFRGLL